MALGQEKLGKAIAEKLRTDTGAGSLVALTNHDASTVGGYRIAADQPQKKGDKPFLGFRIFQSFPLSPDGPTHVQKARIHFRAYSTKRLTSIQIADRIDHLLHARDEQVTFGTNVGFYDFSSSDISNRQTRWRSRDEVDFDDGLDIYMTLVEAELIWIDESCP